MASRPTHPEDRLESLNGECTHDREQAEAILRSINRCFDQVNLATEFFLLKDEPRHSGHDLQLACLIRDRIARIEEQVSDLYRTLKRSRHHGRSSPRQASLLQ